MCSPHSSPSRSRPGVAWSVWLLVLAAMLADLTSSLEAFYLEVIKRLPRTLASIFWGAEAVRGVLLYVMSGLVLGALITLKLGNVTAFFAFLLFFLIVAMSLGTFDLYVERMAGGDDAECGVSIPP